MSGVRVGCVLAACAAVLVAAPAASGRGLLAALVHGDAAALQESDVARRFGLERAFEVSLDLGPEGEFATPEAMDGLAEAERVLTARGLQVVGPSRLLAAAPPAELSSAATAGDVSPVRDRLRHRMDALGWFFSSDDRHVRMLVGGADAAAVRQAVRDSMSTLRAAAPRPDRFSVIVRPLWPERGRRWHALFWPLGLVAMGGFGFFRARRAGRPRRLPLLVLTGALLSVPAALLFPRLEVRVGERGLASLAFVAVRTNLDEPVAMRELRRLTEFARAQPGVTAAWSVADLFSGTGIPDRRDQVRAVLHAAADDPAVGLELAPDHGEALVAVRFEDDSIVQPRVVLDRLQRFLSEELRTAWSVADLRDGGLDPATRLLAQGVLAGDMADRVVAVCRARGKRLGPAQRAAVLRVAREALLVGRADPARLKLDVAADLRRFLAEPVAAGLPPRSAHVLVRMVETLHPLRVGAGREEVARALAPFYPNIDEDALRTPAEALAGRLMAVKRRHAAVLSAQAMVSAIDLPSAGPLSDDVRAAVLDGGGPLVGIPLVGRADRSPSEVQLTAQTVGARAQEGQLSLRLGRVVAWATPATVLLAGVLLVLVHGARGAPMLFVALAPAGAATLVLALIGEPLSLPTVAQLAGSLLGGIWLAAAPLGRTRAEDA